MRPIYPCVLISILCLVFSGCGNSGFQDLPSGSRDPGQGGTRSLTFRFVRAQGTTVPLSIDGFQMVSSGISNNGTSSVLSTDSGPFVEELQLTIPSEATSTKLTLLAGNNPLLSQLFPLTPGESPVVFDGPELNPVFEGGDANSISFQPQGPLQVGDERQLVVVTDDGKVVRGGTFVSSDPNALSVDAQGVARALQANPQVTIDFTIELPELDLAVASVNSGIVSLYDSRNMNLGPLNQFEPFPGSFGGGIEPVVGDFNGDGAQEIGVFNRNGDFRLFDRDGNLQQETSFGQPLARPAAGDFDGDGIDDLAAFSGNTVVLRRVDASGIGSFGLPPGTVPPNLGIPGNLPSTPGVDLFAIESTNRDNILGVGANDLIERFNLGGESLGRDDFEGLRSLESYILEEEPVFSVTTRLQGEVLFTLTDPFQNRNSVTPSQDVGDESVVVSGSTFAQPNFLAIDSSGTRLVEVDFQGNLGATYTPSFGSGPGLRLDRAYAEVPRRTLSTSLSIEVLEDANGGGQPANPIDPLIGDFLTRWAELISSESSGVRDFYEPDYFYNGQTAADLSTFQPGFDLETSVQSITSVAEQGDVLIVRVQNVLSVGSSSPPLQRTSNRTLEMRLVRRPSGSDPAFQIRSQRVVEETVDEIFGVIQRASAPPPTLDGVISIADRGGRPLGVLVHNDSVTAEAQATDLLPFSNTALSSVGLRLAGQDLVMREQEPGRFTVTFTVPPLTPGLYAPTVTAQNRVFEQANDFQNSAAASVSRSLEIEVR